MRGAWQATIVDDNGNVQPFASVEVRDQNGALVSLFDAPTGGSAISNPFDADSEGFARFYCDPQLVDITANTASGVRTWDNVFIAPDVRDLPWFSTPVGGTMGIYAGTSALYPPNDTGAFRYIQLTEGLDGGGGYNEGVLINETITGSGVERQVTAEVSLTGSPLNGVVVHLINSERSHLRPGETAGVFEQDQMQRITGRADTSADDRGLSIFDVEPARFSGALTPGDALTGNRMINGSNLVGPASRTASDRLIIDSSLSPNARTSATTDGETRVKSVSEIRFLRIA